MSTQSRHLLAIALGPVQEFIQQGRRTRDIWFGSFLLSELGRAAARAVVEYETGETEEPCTLIFPALNRGADELKPQTSLLDERGKPVYNVPNRILAIIPAGVAPEDVARAARKGVHARWNHFSQVVWDRTNGLRARNVSRETWDEQVRTLVEFSAAWSPFHDGAYADARRTVERALRNRKILRDFVPWKKQRGTVYKSSLDGGRETVLQPRKKRSEQGEKAARRYRLGRGEELDAVGLIKRAGGKPEQFVPVGNVAMAGWIEQAARVAPSELEHLKTASRTLGLPRIVRNDLAWTSLFPQDAQIFLEFRWQGIFEELGKLQEEARQWGEKHVNPVLDRARKAGLGAPYPYVACLVADGDRMGDTLGRIQAERHHREFSRRLSEFAVRAREIVESSEFKGSLIYAGGDDVVAFLTLPDALACADRLRREFTALMENALARKDLEDVPRPTLSVGIGIGHLLESMGDLIAYGREAEAVAKEGGDRWEGAPRNALAIVLNKRSGSRLTWRSNWADGEDSPVARLERDMAVFQEGLSSKKVYQVGDMLHRLPRPRELRAAAAGAGDRNEATQWTRLLRKDIQQILARSEAGTGVTAFQVGLEFPAEGAFPDPIDCYERTLHAAESWVERLLIARALVQAAPWAHRPKQGTDHRNEGGDSHA